VTRARYLRYVLARIAESLAVGSGAALLALALQRAGWLHAPAPAHAGWAWPAAFAALAHVILGPKQRRPVYRRIPGAMYAYAGIAVSRGAGCRGGCVTGATGSGKTLSCILPRLHSLCVNESGLERPGWRGSPAARELGRRKLEHRRRLRAEENGISRIQEERRASEGRPGGAPGDDGGRILGLRLQGEARDRALQEACDPWRRVRYRVPPWGGLVCGEKGNEWQAVEALLRHHGREEDLCILRTRPEGAPPGWIPAVRLNLLSMADVPADTYAQMIADTSLAVEEAQTRDEFFVPQARDKIAWGIRLARAVGDSAPAGRRRPPSLARVLELLSVQESYRLFLQRSCAEDPRLAASPSFEEARFHLENNYWNQPPDQLGGVRSTVHNFLAPYAQPDVAEVLCADSTLDLADIQAGKVVCVAIPQRLALQRRYASALLKALAYHVILRRFDRRGGEPGWRERNVVLVEQDEWQRHAIRADCEADVVREAQGAVYAAAQSQNAVWLKLGGRERATPLIANLRNRWICQAATDECAEESSALIGGRTARESSYSSGGSGRTTTVTFRDRPAVPKGLLRSLPPFHVVFAPAEGRWIAVRCIAMPATPDGRVPAWWFGDWNPLHWAAALAGLPEKVAGFRLHPSDGFVPPWRACAPLRAQLRRLAGLDGTFIILGRVRARAGARPGA
jgi:hypothetical protein